MTRILVADDDPLLRELVDLVLSEQGYEVVSAANGAVALSEVARFAPDLVLLDLRMPELDGWRFAARYRELPEPKAPLVLLTTANDIAEEAAALGAVDWVEKPFALDRLIGTVRRQIGAAA